MEQATHGDQSIKPPARPLLIVLSGPSGVGKDAVLSRIKASDFPLKYVITSTTRAKRANEKDGVEYNFVSDDKFQEMIQHNELLEYASVYGNWYGVPKIAVKQLLEQGNDVMLKVDVQGVANIRKLAPQAVTIFLMPASVNELEIRLKQRRTESPFDLARRLSIAGEEMKDLSLFDYIVFNRKDEIHKAVSEIRAIITAEKCRVKPREIVL